MRVALYHAMRAMWDITYRSFAKNADSENSVNSRFQRLLFDIDRYYQILQIVDYIAIYAGH